MAPTRKTSSKEKTVSNFAVPIKRIRAILAHPNADAIELAVIDGYRVVVRKGEFLAGGLAAYLPEGSLLPEWLLRALNLWDAEKSCGRLAGKQGNRLKAVKLRGELSQGLLYPVHLDTLTGSHLRLAGDGSVLLPVEEGDDVAQALGVEKYQPPIPVEMAGEVFNAGARLTVDFDVENIKSFPDVFQEGEEVVFTEKLHGTFTGVAVLPESDAHPEAFGPGRNILLFSKGLGAKGLVFKCNERNETNLYVRATRPFIDRISVEFPRLAAPVFLLGETFGPGVQDLAYGRALGFRLFAVVTGYRGEQEYKGFEEVTATAGRLGMAPAPVLFRGPFSVEALARHTSGKTTLDAEHLREGLVVAPVRERLHPILGRVCLKSISDDYLTRKNGTEFN